MDTEKTTPDDCQTEPQETSAPVLLISAATTVLFSIVIATSRELQTVADETGKPLLLTRVRAAQVLALLTALLYALRFGAILFCLNASNALGISG